MNDTTLAIADLHGHPDHLDALLHHADARIPEATLVALGDYADNGPDIPRLLDRLIQLRQDRGERFRCILGNHDLACLRTLGFPGTAPDEGWYGRWSRSYWGWRGGWGSTPEAYGAHSAAELAHRMPAHHQAFLRGLPWFIDTGAYVFVHAGLELGPLGPQLEPLAEKRLPPGRYHLPHPIREKGLARVADSAWTRVVVSGHTKRPGAPHVLTPTRICLSGEVDRTGVLYAIELPSRRIWRVDPDLTVTIQEVP